MNRIPRKLTFSRFDPAPVSPRTVEIRLAPGLLAIADVRESLEGDEEAIELLLCGDKSKLSCE